MCELQWGLIVWILFISLSLYHCASVSETSDLSVSEIQATGKVLFRALRNSECNINCNGKRRRLVCGSDGVTYQSRCHVKKAKRCEDRRVKVLKKGRCSGAIVRKTRCIREREEAQAIARRPTVGIFIPECKKDGSFAETQCHAATGYCWCVSKDGKPVLGTSISGKRPACKGKQRRRKSRGKGKKRKKKICKTSDRIVFNKNLVAVFTKEYHRVMASTSTNSLSGMNERNGDSRLTTLEKKVVLWKFSELDRNKDNKLRRREVRNLKRVVKKIIKPRACAKNFVKYCDLDQNKRIEKMEWMLCLGKDISNEQSTTTPQEPIYREEESILIDHVAPRPPTLWSTSGLNTRRSENPTPVSDGNDNRMKSCAEERDAALRQQQQDPNGKTFIPKCTPDGNWVKAQCHEPSQICWCVKPETGSPISGTATTKMQPNCDLESEREMKGCPFARKRRFLADMLGALTEQMNVYAFNGTDHSKMPSRSTDMSVQEKAARWKFNMLDANSNSKLERKELKSFRKNIPKRKDTRKCRRNFIRYCDENGDRKVSLDEWIDCMGIKYNSLPLPVDTKRRGPNPFSDILNPS